MAAVAPARVPHHVEGFSRPVSVPEGEAPRCSSLFHSSDTTLQDFRGPLRDAQRRDLSRQSPHGAMRCAAWETAPAPAAEDTTFTWIGGSQVRPALRPAYPYVTATLAVNGTPRLVFPLGVTDGFAVEEDGVRLTFEPKSFLSLVEAPHRYWQPHGVTGFYHLSLPGRLLAPGQPVALQVEVAETDHTHETFFFVSPRRDALGESLAVLRAEVDKLQHDLLLLTKSHEMLYAQVYPELFPERLRGERVIALQHPTFHYHPATLTVLRDGEAIITAREADDHLAQNGRMILVRSRDGGRTWGPREVLFDLGRADHRCAPIVELPNGDWVTADYRAQAEYTAQGCFDTSLVSAPTLWGAWSTDRGRSWSFSAEPITVPGSPSPYSEAERHLIRLPDGRLLLAANYMVPDPEGGPGYSTDGYGIAVHASDDDGRRWALLATLPAHRYAIGEPALLRTASGKILLLSRSHCGWNSRGPRWTERGMVLQSVSHDDGRSWSPLAPTTLPSLNSPAHLLPLQDGRILCTHASRMYPGSVYVTVSRDDGETWASDTMKLVANDLQNFDSGYPTTGQLPDGTLLTTWYANLFGQFFIAVLRWLPDQV